MMNTMQPSEIEKKLIKDGNYNIIGTNISGVDNYVGPMVGCSIVLDYYNISRYVDPLLKNVSLTADEVKELIDSFRYHTFHFMEVPTINMVRNLEFSEHMAKFNSANKLVWDMLKKCEVPDAYITADKPLTEVMDTKDDSLHSDGRDRFVLWNTNHSLELVTPKAIFIDRATKSTLVTRITKKLANMALGIKLRALDKDFNEYSISKNPGKEQVDYVKKFGNTIHHRVFLPELSKYPMGKLFND